MRDMKRSNYRWREVGVEGGSCAMCVTEARGEREREREGHRSFGRYPRYWKAGIYVITRDAINR